MSYLQTPQLQCSTCIWRKKQYQQTAHFSVALITHSFTYINRTIGLDAVRVVKVAVVLITGKKNIIFYHTWGVKQQAANSSQVLETTAPVDPKNLYLPLYQNLANKVSIYIQGLSQDITHLSYCILYSISHSKCPLLKIFTI